MKNLIPWKKRENEIMPAWNESDPFTRLHRQMNELFEGFFEGFRLPSEIGGNIMSPRFDVSETDEEVVLDVELPGMDEKDIELTPDKNMLTLCGEKRHENEEKKKNYYISECSYGRFHRSIPLPEGIDEDKVSAKFKNGVLHIEIPKTEDARRHRRSIEITSG